MFVLAKFITYYLQILTARNPTVLEYLSNDVLNLSKLLGIDIAVSIQIEHPECDFKLPPTRKEIIRDV